MAAPKVCVLRAPGTNCDIETAHAFSLAGGAPERVHLFRLLEQPALLKDFQILCFPGGFSYGDDVGAGVVFGSQLRTQLADAIYEYLAADKLVLGICNGFQILMKSGILPGGATTWPVSPESPRTATLTWNRNGRYTSLWTKLRVASTNSPFLTGISEIELPIAHAEGRIAVTDSAILEQWESNGQVALRYTGSSENEDSTSDSQRSILDEPLPYPQNPNGSIGDIAGLSDPTGRVFGLMPHPERFLFETQHPQWTRRPQSDNANGHGDGLKLFVNAVNYFQS